ncbi:MAG: DUF547 domain-containing protein [Chitinophagales bacterium]
MQLSASENDFFKTAGRFFDQYVIDNAVDYDRLKQDQSLLKTLLNNIENFDYQQKDRNEQKAFLINAYNILTISNVINHYPINSPLEISSFFDKKNFNVAGRKVSLDDLEKSWLMKDFFDPRLHFVLVCAAKGCPEIVDYAYLPSSIEQQLENRTRQVINDPGFLKINHSEQKVLFSELFNWYEKDFTQEYNSIEQYIMSYLEIEIPDNYKWMSYPYDWSLNTPAKNQGTDSVKKKNNLQLYTSSVLYSKGTFELRLLNNFYTQNTFFDENRTRIEDKRSTYLTSFFQFTAGLHPRINIGADFIFKSVRQVEDRSENPVKILRFGNNEIAQTQLAFAGPRIKFIPFKKLSNFSVQSTFYIPTAKDMEGSESGRPFLDYDKFFWWNQLFFDQRQGNYLNHFFGLDIIGRFGGKSQLENLVQSPLTYIISAFPTKRLTIYGLGQWFPTFSKDSEGKFGMSQYFIQIGVGTKVYVIENLELELSFNHFLKGRNAGAGEVVNLGVRYVIW